jgi:hypothetical protein
MADKQKKPEKQSVPRESFRNDIANATPWEDLFGRVTSEKSISISLAELASVSPSF